MPGIQLKLIDWRESRTHVRAHVFIPCVDITERQALPKADNIPNLCGRQPLTPPFLCLSIYSPSSPTGDYPVVLTQGGSAVEK